ncbi:MAG: PilZ domain-containing protein [Methylovulum sp.]|nr:PilZ domain-containing protein [Methylovulum sp.]
MTPPNRRKHERAPIEVEYHFLIDSVEYTGKTANISLNGAFLLRPEPELPPACTSQSGLLNIKVRDESLSFKSEVVYVATADNETFPAGAGVAFCETDEATGMAILSLAIALQLD